MAPSHHQFGQMALMAMMDEIIHTNVQCKCPDCRGEKKSKTSTRPPIPKRSTSENENPASAAKSESSSGSCTHHIPERKSTPTTKKPSSPTQSRSSPSKSSSQGRSDKVNTLLKADNVQAVFEVFNTTATSNAEKELAQQIQNVTKDCKLYSETRDKIILLCEESEADSEAAEAVYGLLAKFRHERNLLTTAIIKSNTEREKSLMCVQRVDHLMYLLQDVAKRPKDTNQSDVMHKLSDIIMEIHDLAKTPSLLYDELLDIREEHFDLLADHEEMHQKFVDVNSCHDKLHSSHDKLQHDHTRLNKDLFDVKKKAGLVGSLKNDVSRLEKAVDKGDSENADLKKEVERLSAELAKVNALKHENTQLKKKLTTMSTTPTVEEDMTSVIPLATQTQSQATKKKKGKKTQTITPTATPDTTLADAHAEAEARLVQEKAQQEKFANLQKSYESLAQELKVVSSRFSQAEAGLRNARSERDIIQEKLKIEKASAGSLQDQAARDNDRLRKQVQDATLRAADLKSTIERLESSMTLIKAEMAGQSEAFAQAKAELLQRTLTPAVSVSSQGGPNLSPEMIRLLRKIRIETGQLVRDLDDSRSYGGDVWELLNMVQLSVRRVVLEVERDIEEILSVRGGVEPSSIQEQAEPAMPFSFGGNNIIPPTRQPDRSPQGSPQMHVSSTGPSTLPTYRPMVPPGFSVSSAFNRAVEPPVASRLSAAPSTVMPPPGFGQHRTASNNTSTSTRSTNNNSTTNITPSPISTPAPSVGSSIGGTGNASGMFGLGNGAAGVDWSMWAKPAR